jgi:hypothetical protein
LDTNSKKEYQKLNSNREEKKVVQNKVEIPQIATKKQAIMLFDMVQTTKNVHSDRMAYSHQPMNSELIPNNHINFFYPE